jgi:hypothetical protein
MQFCLIYIWVGGAPGTPECGPLSQDGGCAKRSNLTALVAGIAFLKFPSIYSESLDIPVVAIVLHNELNFQVPIHLLPLLIITNLGPNIVFSSPFCTYSPPSFARGNLSFSEVLKELECIHIIVADDGLKWSTSLAKWF